MRTHGGIFGPDVLGTFDYSGLGAVPAKCWDTPGFNACHDARFAEAQKLCDPKRGGSFTGYASQSACEKAESALLIQGLCVEYYCPQAAPEGTVVIAGQGTPEDQKNYPWGKKSAATATLQQQINVGLKQFERCPINADGYLGGETCGAADYLFEQGGATMTGVPTTCKEFTATKSCPSGKAPPPPPLPQPITPTEVTPKAKESSALMWVGILGIAAVGAYALTRKK